MKPEVILSLASGTSFLVLLIPTRDEHRHRCRKIDEAASGLL
jgi:hypothetical protein